MIIKRDLQENIYATFGSRFDDNSVAGNEEAHRATFAYLFDDKSTKIKSSYGTGLDFPLFMKCTMFMLLILSLCHL